MKTLRWVAVLTFMVVAAALPAIAQGYVMAVKVPFAFTVGDEQFAAGRYTVDAGFNAAVALYDPRGLGRFVPAPTSIPEVGERACKPRLVFHRFGKEIFLAEIWSSRGGQKVLPGNKHRKMLSSARPETVTTAANQ